MQLNLSDSGVTDILGQALAGALPKTLSSGGAVGYFRGELGAGKTSCVRALLRAMGVSGLVRSPTYTLVETYVLPGLTCIHVDLFRLQSLAEIDELGLRDAAGPGCLLLIEWPEKGASALPAADLDLVLRYAGEARQAHIDPRSALGTEWMKNLGHDRSLAPYVSNST